MQKSNDKKKMVTERFQFRISLYKQYSGAKVEIECVCVDKIL